jgi:hypothetical protein
MRAPGAPSWGSMRGFSVVYEKEVWEPWGHQAAPSWVAMESHRGPC